MHEKKIKNTVNLPQDLSFEYADSFNDIESLIREPMDKALREYLIAVFAEVEIELIGSTINIVGVYGDLYELEISMDAHEALTGAFIHGLYADMDWQEDDTKLRETIATLRSSADRLQQKLEGNKDAT